MARAAHWHIVVFEKGTNNVVSREVASSYPNERQASDELKARQDHWLDRQTNYGVQACAERHQHVYRDGRLQIV